MENKYEYHDTLVKTISSLPFSVWLKVESDIFLIFGKRRRKVRVKMDLIEKILMCIGKTKLE